MIDGRWSKPAATGLPRQWLLALVGSRTRLRLLAEMISLASTEQLDGASLAFLAAAARSTTPQTSPDPSLLLGTRSLIRAFAKLSHDARGVALASELPWQAAADQLWTETQSEPNRQRQNRAHAALLAASLDLAAAGHLHAPIARVLQSHDTEARRVGVAIVRTFLDSELGPPLLRATLACQALGAGIAHLSADQLAEACEAIGIAFGKVQLGGAALARGLAPALQPTAETEAARMLLRGKLRRDASPKWHNAAWSLAICPSMAAAAAERLIQDAASGMIDPERAHLLAHPSRLATLRQSHGKQREAIDLAIGEQALLNSGQSVSTSAALARLALVLSQAPRPHRGSAGSISSTASAGGAAPASKQKLPTKPPSGQADRSDGNTSRRDRVAMLLLRSPVAATRQSSVQALARSAAWPALTTSLRDPSPAISRTAEIVVAVRSPGASAGQRAQAAGAARGTGELRAVRWLARSGARPGQATPPNAVPGETLAANDHAMAIELLKLRRRVPTPEITEAVAGLVGDLLPSAAEFERTISAALPAIAWHPGEEGTELLREFLYSPLARLRAGAFEALAKRTRIIGSVSLRRETPVLLRAGLSDTHHRVRGSCLRGLIESCITEVKPLVHRNLLAMASDCEALEQLTALYVIGRSAPSLAGDPAVGQALAATLRSPATAAVEVKATAVSRTIEYLRATGEGLLPSAYSARLAEEQFEGVAA